MNINKNNIHWNGFAASIPGNGHIRHGIPCQDASAVITSPRPAAIVCDGRGSASLSHFGAQEAVAAFRSQMSILEPFLVNILDDDEEKQEQWIKFCRIMYRTLMQVKYNLAEKHNESEREFDCTVAFAIAGESHIGCFQVGDGSIVVRQNGVCKTVFLPEKGEFANQTHFLRPGGEERMDFQYALLDAKANSGIAITSDGPEHLMFQLSDMTPGKIFDMFLDDLYNEELCQQDLMDYLTRREWANDPRGSDDRSLALLTRIGNEPVIVPEPEVEDFVESAPKPENDVALKPVAETEPEMEVKRKASSHIEPDSLPSSEVMLNSTTEAEPETTVNPMIRGTVSAEASVCKKKISSPWTLIIILSLIIGLLAATCCLMKRNQTVTGQQQELQHLRQRLIQLDRQQEMGQTETPSPFVKTPPALVMKKEEKPKSMQTKPIPHAGNKGKPNIPAPGKGGVVIPIKNQENSNKYKEGSHNEK